MNGMRQSEVFSPVSGYSNLTTDGKGGYSTGAGEVPVDNRYGVDDQGQVQAAPYEMGDGPRAQRAPYEI